MRIINEHGKEVVEWITLNMASAAYIMAQLFADSASVLNVEKVIGIGVGATIIIFNVVRTYKIISDERSKKSDREFITSEISRLKFKRKKKDGNLGN